MKKILLSLGIIAVVAIIAVNATGAFFSDSETSTGNTFTAGAIDLQIDSVSTYNGQPWATSTWALKDLVVGSDKFFNFDDIKPGDVGTTTISLHVINNDAYVCAAVSNLASDDNSQTEPESQAPLDTDDMISGELDDQMVWTIWKDLDNDGVQDGGGETVLASGNPTNGVMTLYDSVTGPLVAPDTAYIGVSWALPSSSGNETQTDSLTADISFYTVQSRNNGTFKCSDWVPSEQGNEQGPKVGANLSAYVAPTCNVTVDDTGGNQSLDTIQEGVAAATTGQTVCVDNGTYTGPIEINKDITLASLNGPSVTTINGGVKITSSDVTVKGFTVNAGVVAGEPNPVGFYVASGSNISIDSNDINGAALSTGVLFVTGATYSNVEVTNNKIHNNNAGIYTNPHTGTLAINYNDIYDNNAGIGGLMGAAVQYNEFKHTGVAQEAIGTDGTFDSNVATINFNNFLDGTKINDYGATPIIDAEDNFFNLGGLAQTTIGQVDYIPEEASAFPQN